MEEKWILEQYFSWLSKKVKAKSKREKEVLQVLFDREYIWIIPQDARRASDGLYLRKDFFFTFCEDERVEIEKMMEKMPCNVLEMLVALAIRVDESYTGDPSDPHPEGLFWEMIGNLGLNLCEKQPFGVKSENSKITRFLKKSHVTPFPPAEKWPKNFEKWEIWAQMTHYLAEKGYF